MPNKRRIGFKGLEMQSQSAALLCLITRLSNRGSNRRSSSQSRACNRFKYSMIEISNRAYIACFCTRPNARQKSESALQILTLGPLFVPGSLPRFLSEERSA